MKREKMRIAVCTSNGNEVNLHFGRTESFYIYEMEEDHIAHLEVRSTERYCEEYPSPDHELRPHKLDNIFDKIKDCEILFTARIGEAPRDVLMYKGMSIIECETAISKLPELV